MGMQTAVVSQDACDVHRVARHLLRYDCPKGCWFPFRSKAYITGQWNLAPRYSGEYIPNTPLYSQGSICQYISFQQHLGRHG